MYLLFIGVFSLGSFILSVQVISLLFILELPMIFSALSGPFSEHILPLSIFYFFPENDNIVLHGSLKHYMLFKPEAIIQDPNSGIGNLSPLAKDPFLEYTESSLPLPTIFQEKLLLIRILYDHRSMWTQFSGNAKLENSVSSLPL